MRINSFRLFPFVVFFLFIQLRAASQQSGFSPTYHFIKSNSVVQDKNFYLLTLLERLPEANKIIYADEIFAAITNSRIAIIKSSIIHCADSIICFTKNLLWTTGEIENISEELKVVYRNNPAIKSLVKEHLRPSGYFQQYVSMNDEDLLALAWRDAANGMNYIAEAYTTNQGLRYKNSDSVTYPLNSEYYRIVIKEMMLQVREQTRNIKLFFQPGLRVAMELLFINNRDEAGRYEPLTYENRKAYQLIKTIKWSQYPYSVILSPGEGPENNMPLSPNGKYRCRLAAKRFKKKLAPFIVVSGGHVHPFQTVYCEAIEMKKYLMQEFQIPEDAIIIEPHARHTTTNFRNTNRIIFRQGIPPTKKVLCTTTRYQMDYIADEKFKKINMSYLKHIPFFNLKRLNDFDAEFLPNILSLQMDSLDPLDP
jgi:hypothetical protein